MWVLFAWVECSPGRTLTGMHQNACMSQVCWQTGRGADALSTPNKIKYYALIFIFFNINKKLCIIFFLILIFLNIMHLCGECRLRENLTDILVVLPLVCCAWWPCTCQLFWARLEEAVVGAVLPCMLRSSKINSITSQHHLMFLLLTFVAFQVMVMLVLLSSQIGGGSCWKSLTMTTAPNSSSCTAKRTCLDPTCLSSSSSRRSQCCWVKSLLRHQSSGGLASCSAVDSAEPGWGRQLLVRDSTS